MTKDGLFEKAASRKHGSKVKILSELCELEILWGKTAFYLIIIQGTI